MSDQKELTPVVVDPIGPSRVPQSTDELVGVASAIASLMDPLVRGAAQAEVEKARIDSETQRHIVDAQTKVTINESDHRHSRFVLIAVLFTVVGLVLISISIMLIAMGKTEAGLLVVSHLLALVTGLFGGRGFSRSGSSTDSGDES